MLLLATILTASINIDIDLTALLSRTAQRDPQVTCGISTVGYKFVGKPGQQFRYAGDIYEMPPEGWVELIADKRRTTYSINGSSLPLEIWPTNQFGFREVPLPSPDSAEKGEMQ